MSNNGGCSLNLYRALLTESKRKLVEDSLIIRTLASILIHDTTTRVPHEFATFQIQAKPKTHAPSVR